MTTLNPLLTVLKMLSNPNLVPSPNCPVPPPVILKVLEEILSSTFPYKGPLVPSAKLTVLSLALTLKNLVLVLGPLRRTYLIKLLALISGTSASLPIKKASPKKIVPESIHRGGTFLVYPLMPRSKILKLLPENLL